MDFAQDDLVAKFQEFCTLAGSKDNTMMTSKASIKLVTECFDKGYRIYDVMSICEASVFPAVKEKEKPYMVVNKGNVDKYISKTAHEIAKRKTKNTKIAAEDPEVAAIKADLCSCVCGGGSNVELVKGTAKADIGF